MVLSSTILEDNRKLLRMAEEKGISVDYRCPKCRACSDCRNSVETEKVSLREEAEDAVIAESVVLDWKRKMIRCFLPLRDEPQKFLSPNQYDAEQILMKQCKKLKI